MQKIWLYYMMIGGSWFIFMMYYVYAHKKRIREGFLIVSVFLWLFSLLGWLYSKATGRPNPMLTPFDYMVDE